MRIDIIDKIIEYLSDEKSQIWIEQHSLWIGNLRKLTSELPQYIQDLIVWIEDYEYHYEAETTLQVCKTIKQFYNEVVK